MSQPGIKNEKRTTQDAINMINQRYGNKFNTDKIEYINADTNFTVKCNRCGKEFKKKYYDLDKDGYEPCDYCRRIENNKLELMNYLNQNFPNNRFELL